MDDEKLNFDLVKRAFPFRRNEVGVTSILSLSTSYSKRFSTYGDQDYVTVESLRPDTLYSGSGESKARLEAEHKRLVSELKEVDEGLKKINETKR